MKKRIAYFSIFLGLMVIGMWLDLLLKGSINEGTTAISFHIFAEFIMAVICVVSGIAMIRNKPYGIETNILCMGMVVYSTLNAAGYYGQQGQRPMMIIFLIICALAAFTIIGDFKLLAKK
jgi:hypothetical protein